MRDAVELKNNELQNDGQGTEGNKIIKFDGNSYHNNSNGKISPSKDEILSEWIKIHNPSIICLWEKKHQKIRS